MVKKVRCLGFCWWNSGTFWFWFIGASLLWVGLFGFNAGSALAAGGLATSAFVATHMATAAAALSWMFMDWIFRGKPTVLGAASGAVAGLVAITPASGFFGALASIIFCIGGGGAVLSDPGRP